MKLKTVLTYSAATVATLIIIYIVWDYEYSLYKPRKTIETLIKLIKNLKLQKNQSILNKSEKKAINNSNNNSISLINQYINIVNLTAINHSFVEATLKTERSFLLIYVHHSGDVISRSLLVRSTWEPNLLAQFEQYIKDNPGIQMLDIGCNVGVYTLTAAALGCTVVAVDANPNNTARVVQSLIANGIENKTTVLLNAMSNVRKYFVIGLAPQNIGGSNVLETENDINRVKGIFLDDLIPFFDKSKEIAIKIDIEGKEIDTLKKAANFFAEHQVTLVMLEWGHIKKSKDIKSVIDFFTSRSFKSFTNIHKNQPLSLESYISWPYDIFWMK